MAYDTAVKHSVDREETWSGHAGGVDVRLCLCIADQRNRYRYIRGSIQGRLPPLPLIYPGQSWYRFYLQFPHQDEYFYQDSIPPEVFSSKPQPPACTTSR